MGFINVTKSLNISYPNYNNRWVYSSAVLESQDVNICIVAGTQ